MRNGELLVPSLHPCKQCTYYNLHFWMWDLKNLILTGSNRWAFNPGIPWNHYGICFTTLTSEEKNSKAWCKIMNRPLQIGFDMTYILTYIRHDLSQNLQQIASSSQKQKTLQHISRILILKDKESKYQTCLDSSKLQTKVWILNNSTSFIKTHNVCIIKVVTYFRHV